MSQIHIFKSTDIQAPQLTTIGDIKTIIKACLITGYGNTAPAGWDMVFDDANRIVLKNKSRFNDENTEFEVAIDENNQQITKLNIGTNLTAIESARQTGYFCSTHIKKDGPNWAIFADDLFAWVFIRTEYKKYIGIFYCLGDYLPLSDIGEPRQIIGACSSPDYSTYYVPFPVKNYKCGVLKNKNGVDFCFLKIAPSANSYGFGVRWEGEEEKQLAKAKNMVYLQPILWKVGTAIYPPEPIGFLPGLMGVSLPFRDVLNDGFFDYHQNAQLNNQKHIEVHIAWHGSILINVERWELP